MSKGDSIRVYARMDTGVFDQVIQARQNGRKVDYSFEKDGSVQWLVVTETTRGGTVVDEARFGVGDVIAIRRLIKGE